MCGSGDSLQRFLPIDDSLVAFRRHTVSDHQIKSRIARNPSEISMFLGRHLFVGGRGEAEAPTFCNTFINLSSDMWQSLVTIDQTTSENKSQNKDYQEEPCLSQAPSGMQRI